MGKESMIKTVGKSKYNTKTIKKSIVNFYDWFFAHLYAESLVKPDFEVSENTIKIVLPVFETNANLTEDEKVIYKILSKIMLKPISEIAPYVPFGKSKTIQLLKTMGKKV